MRHWTHLAWAVVFVGGCDSGTPEEKALTTERVALVKMEADIVDKTPKSCGELKSALGQFEKDNHDRITKLNTSWTALDKKKQDTVMKPHRSESNPYFEKLISPLIQCGAVFPVK